jgi:hypothetical protein
LCREYVRVVDARTGAVTAGFNLPPGVEVQGLSPDGTKIVGARLQQARTRRGWRAWLRWYAVSSAGGRIANRVDLPLEVYAPTLYDPTHDRLYALQPFQTNEAFTPIQGPFGEGAMTWETVSDFEGMRPLKPGPSRLLAYDLRTSHQVARLVLSGVTYGSWPGQSWTPGLALSPDGRQVALYDGRTNRLTLIDAMRMRIVKTETISRPQSLVARLAQWLGLTPTEAWAKGEAVSGVDLQMRYSPDGRYLYVTGTESSPGPRNPSIGIRAIDMARGVISGEALKGQTLAWIQPEPDGGALYTLVIIGDGTAPVPMIRRLDPETLRVMAQGLASLDSPNPRYYVLAAPAR